MVAPVSATNKKTVLLEGLVRVLYVRKRVNLGLIGEIHLVLGSENQKVPRSRENQLIFGIQNRVVSDKSR